MRNAPVEVVPLELFVWAIVVAVVDSSGQMPSFAATAVWNDWPARKALQSRGNRGHL